MIKPIETEYRGYKFRSRLEARWAVFFDAIGADWEYEPEGFDLGDGCWYLPDFVLHNMEVHTRTGGSGTQDVYIEVKGVMTEKDAQKIKKFAQKAKEGWHVQNPIYIVGNIPDPDDFDWPSYDDHYGVYYYNYELLDGDHFGAYLLIGKNGKPGFFGDDGNYFKQADLNATSIGLKRARSARFEHNEKPNTQSVVSENIEKIREEWITFLKLSGITCEKYLSNMIKYKGIKHVLYYSDVPEDVNEGIIVVNENMRLREDIAKDQSRFKKIAISVGKLPTESEYCDRYSEGLSDWKLFYNGSEKADVDIVEYRYNDDFFNIGDICWIQPELNSGKPWLKPKYIYK